VKRGRYLFALGLIVGLMIGAFAMGSAGIGVRAQDTTAPAEMPAVDVVKKVASSVVTVVNEQSDGGSNQLQPAGLGTGFIIDVDGHIVTNYHVVEGGQEFQIIFSNGQTQAAKLVGADEISDLAVVEVTGEVPGFVSLGNSDALLPGQPVLAIGSALGNYTNTVTQGIISATHRDFPNDSKYTNLIQHDAAINPGNSGGPLFNLSGEVIGVNTLGIPVENGVPVQGLFFAIPSNTVAKITKSLIDNGRAIYPYGGVRSQPVSPQVAAHNHLIVDHGVLVTVVTPGGPAEAAGIEVGDVILSIDDITIDAQNSFLEVLFEHKPGETVDAKIQRGDQTLTLHVTLVERPEGT
jgi:2-alkenal reductase